MLDAGFYEFKLDYSKTTNHAIGDVVYSDKFSAGGHIWRVQCNPRGAKASKGEHLSLYLELVGKSKNVKAIFDAFMVQRDGAPSSLHASRCVHVYLPADTWGWSTFVKRSDVESLYLVNGEVKIMCGVIVIPHGEHMAVPPSDLGTHLGGLLERGDGADVSFVVGGETFQAHRGVLAARSPVLRAQLFGSMAEASVSCITLQDIEPATFNVLLRFMYTDELPADEELGTEALQDLLAAADKYDLKRMKLICAQKLWETVSVDTISATLGFADMHNCPDLKKRCLDFFMAEDNFKHAVVTEGYSWLMNNFKSVVDEIRERLNKK